MSTDKMREEFEAWYLKRFGNCDMQSGWAMERWEAWQASRAALVIELPAPHNDYDNYRDSEIPGACKHYDAARKAIEAAGLKVAP